MDDPSEKLKSMGTQSKETVDLAAAKAREVADGARKTADHAIDKVAGKVDDVKNDVGEAVGKTAGVASAVAGAAEVRYNQFKDRARAQAASVSDKIGDYTEADPLKAMLLAAAAGAVLMALLSLMARSRD